MKEKRDYIVDLWFKGLNRESLYEEEYKLKRLKKGRKRLTPAEKLEARKRVDEVLYKYYMKEMI